MCLSTSATKTSASPSSSGSREKIKERKQESHKNQLPRMNEKFEPLNFSLNESKRSERYGVGRDRRRHHPLAGSKVVQHFFPGTSAGAWALLWLSLAMGLLIEAYRELVPQHSMGHPPKAKSKAPQKQKTKSQGRNYQNACRQTPRRYQRPKQPQPLISAICCCTVWLELQVYLTKPFSVPDTFSAKCF